MAYPSAGVEAAVHMIRSITNVDPNATIIQTDGIEAFDYVKRAAMLDSLAATQKAHWLLPFIMQSYGHQNVYVRHDQNGISHEILQGEIAEQGDAFMPGLFALSLAGTLKIAHPRLHANEIVIVYPDDIYIIIAPSRARAAYDAVTQILQERCGIRSNLARRCAGAKDAARVPLALRC